MFPNERRAKVEEDREGHSHATLDRITSGDTFAKLVGTELLELKPGFARTTLKITEHIVNMFQMAHGGAIFTLADLACEAVGNSFSEPAVAIQTNIHFLAPGKCGDILTATAKLINRIDSFGVIEFEIKNHDERLLSLGQQTIIFRKKI